LPSLLTMCVRPDASGQRVHSPMSFQMSSSVSFDCGKLASSLGVISPKRVSCGGGGSSSGVLFVVRLAISVCSGVDEAALVCIEGRGARAGGKSFLTDACALRRKIGFCSGDTDSLNFSATGEAATFDSEELEKSSTLPTPSSRKYETYSLASLINSSNSSFKFDSAPVEFNAHYLILFCSSALARR